ncbi:pilus assembly protein CpaC [Rhodoblastus acidophilus]|uniref:type II and III secretion system protein family protein n=1 Tax=Rhodoblastus acidophilus TaxID=1074 RepID=UPI002224B2AB|nr:type II and III secretion system protein family protein [Rhodoblastus acidophilus]MCW2314647.1 pilus assembly protein CpaC [Rhodoblastus acidophilus]
MHMTRPWLIAGLSVLLGLSSPALAPVRAANIGDGEIVRFTSDRGARHVNMGVGKSVILELPVEAGEIFVGNPAVANAVVRSAKKIYVIGQSAGQTTIYAMDKQGRRIASLELSIGRDIAELQDILRAAMPSSKVVARTVNDSIILTGEVDSAADMQTAMDVAKGFVQSANGGGGAGGQQLGQTINAMSIRGRDQVMIKVTIAEVQRTVTKQLGVTASTLAGNWGKFAQDNPFALNGQSYSSGALTTKSNFGGGNSLSQTLQAFERNGVARVLAEPTVTAVSGESAKFTVGGEVPISSGTTCSGQGQTSNCLVSVTYKTYGVTLNFTPIVLSAGRISLRLATEVAEIDPATTVSTGTVSAPGFRTRRHETTVELPTGGSIATAGLIQSNTNQSINGVPGVMNLPILGSLFRSRDYQRQETELMIIVTPYIAKSVGPNALARPDDNYADSNDPQAWLLGRVNKLYSTTDNPEAAKHFSGRVGFIHD